MTYAIRDEYEPQFGRQRLTLWSGAFASIYEGQALELPGHNGYMVSMYDGRKLRVLCESPRSGDNYSRVDAAISDALSAGLDEPIKRTPGMGTDWELRLDTPPTVVEHWEG